jgi:signal peptidase I
VGTLVKLVVWIALIFGAFAAFLRATCLSTWTFPSDDALLSLSVMPTLEAGDVLLLWRVGTPGFGELVRCPDPEAEGRFVVGRILGEQGDRIETDLAAVSVNNKIVGSRRVCDPAQFSVFDPRTGEPFDLSCEIEEAGGNEYTRARATTPAAQSTPFRVKVPEGNVFLASDNRHYHDDSRDFGPLPKDRCHERIVFRLWSGRGWFDEKRRAMFIH